MIKPSTFWLMDGCSATCSHTSTAWSSRLFLQSWNALSPHVSFTHCLVSHQRTDLLLAAHSLHSNIFMIYLFILYEILNVELWKRNKITDIIFLPTFHWTNDGKDDRRLCFVTRWFYLRVKRRLRSSTRNQQWISWSSLGNLDWHQHLSEYQCLGCRIWKN